MRPSRVISLLITGVLLAHIWTVAAGASSPSFVGLGFLPNASTKYSTAVAVSSSGLSVGGNAQSGSGIDAVVMSMNTSGQAVLKPLGCASLGYYQGAANMRHSFGMVLSLNDDAAVGKCGDLSANIFDSFLWRPNSGISKVNPPVGYNFSVASGVGRAGASLLVVGTASKLVGMSTFDAAFEYDVNGSRVLPPLLQSGQGGAVGVSGSGTVVVGSGSARDGAVRAWVQDNATERPTPLPCFENSTFCTAAAVSADGSCIVGSGMTGPGESTAWRLQTQHMATAPEPLFDFPGGQNYSTAAAASSGCSVVVGQASMRAVAWTSQGVILDLTQAAQKKGLAKGWSLEAATGVSADGRVIVGYGLNAAKDFEGWVLRGLLQQ